MILPRLAPAVDELEGAVFVDGFFASSQRRATQEFVAAYRSAYGGTPDILEAQAYDAAKLVDAALQGGARSRPSCDGGTALARAPSKAPAARWRSARTGIQRQLFLLRIATGTISEVSPTHPPEAPAPPPVPLAQPAMR